MEYRGGQDNRPPWLIWNFTGVTTVLCLYNQSAQAEREVESFSDIS